MLNLRLYRGMFVPLLIALIAAAFAFEKPDGVVDTTLTAEAFNASRAIAELDELAARFPNRTAGGDDDNELASYIERSFRSSELSVTTRSFTALTPRGKRKLRTVIAVRPGISDRRIVVIAHRDSLQSPAEAELSGTAALLELARVYEGRRSQKTLVFVSTSGGSAGGSGAQEFASHASNRIDAVLVLGDLASKRIRKPMVIPWSNADQGSAPIMLRKTVERAVRQELGSEPGGARLLAQLARLAFPLTIGEQGQLLAEGVPAVLLQGSGELGPAGDDPVSQQRFEGLGRAALRSISAIDSARSIDTELQAVVVIKRQLLPAWAIQIIALALLLPLLLAIVDGIARLRRRGVPVIRWFSWLSGHIVPLVFAALFIRVVGWLGLVPNAAPGALPGIALHPNVGSILALVGAVMIYILARILVLRFLLKRAELVGEKPDFGASAALAVMLGALSIGILLINPFAALIALPTLHIWLLIVGTDLRFRTVGAAVFTIGSLAPGVLMLVYYFHAFAISLPEVPFALLGAVAGGGLTPGQFTACSLLLAALSAVVAIVFSSRNELSTPDKFLTRGPLGHAGPGALGGPASKR